MRAEDLWDRPMSDNGPTMDSYGKKERTGLGVDALWSARDRVICPELDEV